MAATINCMTSHPVGSDTRPRAPIAGDTKKRPAKVCGRNSAEPFRQYSNSKAQSNKYCAETLCDPVRCCANLCEHPRDDRCEWLWHQADVYAHVYAPRRGQQRRA